jgi:hypothetical protein
MFRTGHAASKICQNRNIETILLANKLISGFNYKNSAAKIGYEYLKNTPHEADIGILLNYICGTGINQKSRFKETSIDDMKMVLRKKCRDDFTREQVVSVRGWVLSNTEARLCALAVLV